MTIHYRIHDLESFNRVPGAGHEVAGLCFYQQLDCLVDLAYGVACDFFKRPHLYVNVDGLNAARTAPRWAGRPYLRGSR